MRGSGLTRYPAHNPTTIMPTLDDTPTLEELGSSDVVAADLILVYDVSEQKVKAISLTNLKASTLLD